MYGQELIIDAEGCDSAKFNRANIGLYLAEVVAAIGATPCALHWWDDLETPEEEKQTRDKTTGTTAIQFLLESNITIHTLDHLREVYVNVFYCGQFDHDVVINLTNKYFGGSATGRMIIRGKS